MPTRNQMSEQSQDMCKLLSPDGCHTYSDLSHDNDLPLMCIADHQMCTEVSAPKDVYLPTTNVSLHLSPSTNDMPKHLALAMSKIFSSSL